MHKLETITQAINDRTLPQLVKSAQISRAEGPNAPLSEDLTEKLWGLMASMYGHKWVSSFGAKVDPDRVWASCLKGISEEQIKHGLNRCATECKTWPPSAPEFRALCVDWSDGTSVDWEHRRIAAADQAQGEQPKRLEDLTYRERKRQEGRERMAKLRAECGI